MKIMNFMKETWLLLVAVFTLVACGGDDERVQTLALHEVYTEVDTHASHEVGMLGNGDYDLKVANPDIAYVQVTRDKFNYHDCLLVSGKKKGETIVTVTDKKTKSSMDLEVKVVDDYLGFMVSNGQNSEMPNALWFYLVNDANHSAYYFRSGTERENGGPYAVGKWRCTVEKNDKGVDAPFLYMDMPVKDGTYDANGTMKTLKFDISGSNMEAFYLYTKVLGVDDFKRFLPIYDAKAHTRTSIIEIKFDFLEYRENGKGWVDIAYSVEEHMPYHILK